MTPKCAKRYKFLKAIPIVGAALYAAAVATCVAPSGLYMARMTALAAKVELILLEFDVYQAHGTMVNTINALNKMNDEIYKRFPEAVSVQAEQIAKEYKVRNIYFDDNCANGSGDAPRKAGSCQLSDKRQGMNLPIIKTPEMGVTKRLEAHLRFCSGLHFGTSGFQLPTGGILTSVLPGGIGATAMNGSFVLRGFDMLEGPLQYGGPNDNEHLRDHVNDETEIGQFLEEYTGENRGQNVYDGVINPHKLALDSARTVAKGAEVAAETAEAIANPPDFEEAREELEASGDTGTISTEEMEDALGQLQDAANDMPGIDVKKPMNVGGPPWPYEQEEDNNVYKDLVNIRTGLMCAGDPIGALGPLSSLSSTFSFATGALPNINVWHPAEEGPIPSIQPSIDDFSDHYKVVAFSQRKPNNRWAPDVFGNPTDNFFTFSQAIVLNPDEIGLFSQNWEAMLMPAKKFEEKGADIVSRMRDRSPDGFNPLADRLDVVVGQGSWANVVVR